MQKRAVRGVLGIGLVLILSLAFVSAFSFSDFFNDLSGSGKVTGNVVIEVGCGNGVVESGEQCDLGSGNGACPLLCSSNCTINLQCGSTGGGGGGGGTVGGATTVTSSNCLGCIANGVCVPVGYRFLENDVPSYCDVFGTREQKVNTENLTQSCQNSYECESNTCSSGECVESEGLNAVLYRILCKITNFLDSDAEARCIAEYIYGACVSDWTCSDWGDCALSGGCTSEGICDVNGLQTRTCSDTKSCSVPTNVPALTQSCSIIQNPVCGNNVVETAEECDDGNLVNGDGCSSLCLIERVSYTCGNGLIDLGEQCDGSNLNGQSCQSKGFDSGELTCNNTCGFDISGCKNRTQSLCGEKTCLDFTDENGNAFVGGELICDSVGRYDVSDCFTQSNLDLFMQGFSIGTYEDYSGAGDPELYIEYVTFGSSIVLADSSNGINGNAIRDIIPKTITGFATNEECFSIVGQDSVSGSVFCSSSDVVSVKTPLKSFGNIFKAVFDKQKLKEDVAAELLRRAADKIEELKKALEDKAESDCKSKGCGAASVEITKQTTNTGLEQPTNNAECKTDLPAGYSVPDLPTITGNGPTKAQSEADLLNRFRANIPYYVQLIFAERAKLKALNYCQGKDCSYTGELIFSNIVSSGNDRTGWTSTVKGSLKLGCEPKTFNELNFKMKADITIEGKWTCAGLCGNGIIDENEECDGEDLGGCDCSCYDMLEGPLTCNSDCTWNNDNCKLDNICSTSSDYGCSGASPGDSCTDSSGNPGGTCTYNGEGTCSCLGAPYCGNGVCDSGEDYNSCPQDCSQPPEEYCGDGSCNNGEDCYSCSIDCGEPGPYGCEGDNAGFMSNIGDTVSDAYKTVVSAVSSRTCNWFGWFC